MKIINLVAENFKRISVVDITPTGNLVQISGRNQSGKTSVLDAMWAAIGGKDHIQSQPIQRGKDHAKIVLNLGEMTVTRTFRRGKDGKEDTTDVRVENAEGFRPSSPQKLLDTLISKVSFDPMAFLRAKPGEQFEILRNFVPGFDFAAADKAQKADFAERRDVNRSLKDMRAAADAVVVPSGLPAEFADEAALMEALGAAGTHNGLIETRRERRANTETQVGELRENARVTREGIVDALQAIGATYSKTKASLQDEVADVERRLALLKQRLVDCDTALEEAVAAEGKRLMDLATSMEGHADQLRLQIDTAAPLPEPIDVAGVQAQLAEARRVNDGIRARNERDRTVIKAEALETRSKGLTKAIEDRDASKAAAIKAAALPVDGLGFGEDCITLDGLPFDQASDAQQLRTSVAIAMAGNPKLRVIRIRDGSLLDDDGMAALADMADRYDCQVWIEVVDSTGKIGFVLEDGMLKPTGEGTLV